MSEPISQHIVPKCYLQNFAVEIRKGEPFVDVMFNKSGEEKIHRQNVKNICKIREFYTFDDLPDNEKRWLEKFYSHHIESAYHEMYQALTDPKVQKISADLKTKILTYIISQELRTPKLSEALNSISNRTIEYAFLANEQFGTQKKIYSEGKQILDLEGKTLKDAIKENENENRQSANLEAVRRLKRIAELKFDNHILITKYEGSFGLISSDRPVHAEWPLYNPDATMSIPLNSTHMLTLYPFDKELDNDTLKIMRLDHKDDQSNFYVDMYNMYQVEKADYFLYGKGPDILRAKAKYRELMGNHK